MGKLFNRLPKKQHILSNDKIADAKIAKIYGAKDVIDYLRMQDGRDHQKDGFTKDAVAVNFPYVDRGPTTHLFNYEAI